MASWHDVDALVWDNICWALCGLSYFFLFTTIIHFGCTSWQDPRLPITKHSSKWRYFMNAHILRVINLVIAIADMTFEQIADTITSDNTRVLGSTVDCASSARIRMSLYMSSFYTYALFCWYKVGIVTMQSPDRHHQPSFAEAHRRSSASKSKSKTACWRHLIRREHWFLDCLWYYIHLLFLISITLGNLTADPRHQQGSECQHNDDWTAIIAYIVAVFIEFMALIIIFVTPLYQLMKTKKRVFRNVFSNIKIIRKKQVPQQQHVQQAAHKVVNSNHGYSDNLLLRQESNDSSNSPAQQEFISRIKSTICRNFIAGCISILLFSAFMAVYTFDAISGSNFFFDSGFGYVISFSCYILNYLCLTFSYQNHWPMLLPIVCVAPWHRYKYSGAKISLVDSQEFKASTAVKSNIPPFNLNEGDEDEGKRLQQQGSSASIPIVKATHNRKGNGSFESLLASSHLSATPKYHTLSQNDNVRMQKQYEEYLRRQQVMAEQQRSRNEQESTATTSKSSEKVSGQMERKLLTPSAAQEQADADNVIHGAEDEESVESSDEYDSEDIESIQLREGSYDAVDYRFSSIGYHDADK